MYSHGYSTLRGGMPWITPIINKSPLAMTLHPPSKSRSTSGPPPVPIPPKMHARLPPSSKCAGAERSRRNQAQYPPPLTHALTAPYSPSAPAGWCATPPCPGRCNSPRRQPRSQTAVPYVQVGAFGGTLHMFHCYRVCNRHHPRPRPLHSPFIATVRPIDLRIRPAGRYSSRLLTAKSGATVQ